MGDEVRVSTPVNNASGMAKPFIFLSNIGKASRNAVMAYAGNAVLKSVKFTPGVYEGDTLPSAVEVCAVKKSPTNCAGA